MALSKQNFAEHFHDLGDEELLQIAADQEHLTGTALLTLDEELQRRHLGPDDIRAFKESQASGLTATAEEPPECTEGSRVELPADWFDEGKWDTKEQTVAHGRPKGVTVAGLMFCASTLSFVVNGMAALGEYKIATFIINIMLAIGVFATGVGVWHLRKWARRSAVVLCWTCAVLFAAASAAGAIQRLRGFATDPIVAVEIGFGFVWSMLWALYFGRPRVRTAFERSAAAVDNSA